MEIGINTRKSPTAWTKREKAKNPCRDLIWKTRTPSLSMQHPHQHRVRSTSWPPFFGTFSTMTEGLTWPFSRNWRTQQTTRSRSFRQQTWLTLLATWHRPLATCRIKLNKWRRSPTSAIESDYSGLKVFWATRIIQLQVSSLYFDLALIATSCLRVQIRASLPIPQLPKNSLAAARCVWNIWKDVKLLTCLFGFLRTSFWYVLSNCHSRGATSWA